MTTKQDDETPLALATDDQIVEELAKRHVAVVVAFVRNRRTITDGVEALRCCWRGGFTMAVGLLRRFQIHMDNVSDDDTTNTPA